MIENAEFLVYCLLAILGAWSLGWLLIGLYSGFSRPEKKAYWLTHAAWVTVNLGIVGAGLFLIRDATFDSDFVTLQRNIVAINAFLDVGYMLIAKLMQRSSREIVQQAGRAVLIQGAFLFVLDLVFALIFTLLLR